MRKLIRRLKRERYHKKHPERGAKTALLKKAKGIKSKFQK